ncbi:dihydroorotate dehydrogenase [Botrytis cinerea]
MSNPLLRTLRTSRPILSSSPSRISTKRFVSTSTETSPVLTRSKNLLVGTSIALALGFGYLYITDSRASVHQWLVVPALRAIYPDAEDAHHVGTKALKTLYSFGLHPRDRSFRQGNTDKADLSVEVWGQKLQNPIGTSAGLDKLAEVPDALFALGPAIVEVGGCTPLAQDGNPKPRVFRIPSQNALINRYGLNSKGADDMAMRLRERVRLYAYQNGLGVGEDAEKMVLNGEAGVPPGSLLDGKLLAVQVAKNKNTNGDDIEAVKRDYVHCVERLAPYADILVVNVEPLSRILEGVVGAAKSIDRKTKPRVMVKVSPDEDQDEQIEGIVEAVWRSGVDGIIVGNTTNRRDKLIPDDIKISARESRILEEQGGFSGPPMFERTLSLVKRYRTLLDRGPPQQETTPESNDNGLVSTIAEKAKSLTGNKANDQKVIFATGGITNGKQALEVLNAGANVAQVYTAMVYGGAGTITRIKTEMSNEISKK